MRSPHSTGNCDSGELSSRRGPIPTLRFAGRACARRTACVASHKRPSGPGFRHAVSDRVGNRSRASSCRGQNPKHKSDIASAVRQILPSRLLELARIYRSNGSRVVLCIFLRPLADHDVVVAAHQVRLSHGGKGCTQRPSRPPRCGGNTTAGSSFRCAGMMWMNVGASWRRAIKALLVVSTLHVEDSDGRADSQHVAAFFSTEATLNALAMFCA